MKKEREKEGKEGMLGGKEKRRTKGRGKGEWKERDGIGGGNFIL